MAGGGQRILAAMLPRRCEKLASAAAEKAPHHTLSSLDKKSEKRRGHEARPVWSHVVANMEGVRKVRIIIEFIRGAV